MKSERARGGKEEVRARGGKEKCWKGLEKET